MKKLTLLTSVLALAACGGGSGGGAPGPINTRNAIVRPENAVDSDSGLSMIDINKERNAIYERAVATVESLENENDIDTNVSVTRSASVPRNGGIHQNGAKNYTAEDVNAFFDNMNAILVQHNTVDKTVHDVLMALAAFLGKDEIFTLLDYDKNSDDGLETKVQDFADVLDDDNKPEAIQDVLNNAKSVYDDFGQEFTLTLADAEFKTGSTNNHFTFVFDDNGKIASLEKTNGTDTMRYGVLSGGKFEGSEKGTEYYVMHQFGEGNNTYNFHSDKFYQDGENPTEEQIHAELLAEAQSNNPYAFIELEWLENWLDTNPPIIRAGDTCQNDTGCIVYAPVDYTEQISVESQGQELGLKYSDFGLKLETAVLHPGHVDYDIENGEIYHINKDLTYVEHGAFAGGYPGKLADTPTSDMTFKGTAYAGVTRKGNNWASDLSNYVQPETDYYRGSSTLTVSNNGANQNLVADFTDAGWYKVTVNNLNSIEFDGNITSKFNVSKDNNGNPIGDIENRYIGYYGPESNNATEAVGFVQYVERPQNATSETSWSFKADIAFGGAKQ